jgi:hypothetical protein
MPSVIAWASRRELAATAPVMRGRLRNSVVIDMAAMLEARRVAARRIPGRCAYDRGRTP